MSEEESEVDGSEEVDEEASEVSLERKSDGGQGQNARQTLSASRRNQKGGDKGGKAMTTAASKKARKKSDSDEDDDESANSSTSSNPSQPTGLSSGAPLQVENAAHMTFDGGGISDDEANSWEDEISESDESGNAEYYDEEDDAGSPEPKKEVVEEKKDTNTAAEEPNQDPPVEEETEEERGRLLMNVHCTEYDIVKKVARKCLGFKIRHYVEDHDGAIRKGQHNQKVVKEYDVTWHDLSITPDFLAKLNPYQKVNHYPGMYSITRKNHLARNLMRMKRAFPTEFTFFPSTWVLPGDNIDFRNQFYQQTTKDDPKARRQTYIVKPDGLSQGKGIFLARRMETILNTIEQVKDEEGIGGWVVQHYIDQPHLIDDLKYDLRIYVLINCLNPLRIYIHEEGLARFCTEPYRKPTARNLDNLYMHLTNYAINKNSAAYAAGEEESGDEESGHKRSLKAIMKILQCCGADSEKLYTEIKDIIVKTITASHPYLSHLYRSCQPEDLDGSMCFQILGFDIMIDKQFRPWLIEVNQSPSFATDSPLDYKTKKAVLTDTFNMLNCSAKKRKQILKTQQEQMESRILTGKQAKLEPEEKARLKEQKLQERFNYEMKRKGQWELILPWPDEERNNRYNDFIKKAQLIWDEFTTGKKHQHSTDDKRGHNTSHMGKNNNASVISKNGHHAKTSLSNTNTNTGSTANLRTPKPSFNHKVVMSTGGGSSAMRAQAQQHNETFNPVAARAAIMAATSQHQSLGASRINIGQQAPVPAPGQLGNNSIGIAKRHPQGGRTEQVVHMGKIVPPIGLVKKRLSMNLEVIEQQTQESRGASNQDSSIEHMMAHTTQQLSQQHHQQKFKLKLFGGQVKGVSNDPVMDHLKFLTQPTSQYHREKSMNDQQMLQQRIEAEKRRIKSYINPNLVCNGIAGDKTLQSSDSKTSFMQQQIEAHHLTREQIQRQQGDKSRDRLSPKSIALSSSGLPLQQYRNFGEDRVSNMKVTSYNTVGTSDGISGQTTALPQSQGADAMVARRESSNLRKSPGSKNGSSEGLSSLQMAGSEQLNFMIASNYPGATMNIEQFKQQMQAIHLSHDQKALISQAYQSSQAPRVQFTSTLPPSTALPSAILMDSLTSPNLRQKTNKNQHLLINQSQPQSKQQIQNGTFESLRQLDTGDQPVGGEITTFSEKSHKSHALTEQKVLAQSPTLLPHEGRFVNQSNLKLTSKGANEFEQDIGGVTEDPKATTVGSRTSGFPSVMQVKDDATSYALAQKKAVKMTQMPLFIEEANHLSHRSMIMKKETPRQQFKNLPGINSNNEQHILYHQAHLASEMMGSRAALIGDGPKTVARTQTKKLDSSSTLQKSLHNGRGGSSFHNSAQVQKTVIKPMPSYHNVFASGQDPIEDIIYYQRRANGFQNSSGHEKKEPVGSSVQGSLAANSSKKVSMQPHAMYGNNTVNGNGPPRYQVGANGDEVREQQQTTTMTSTGNRINNNITGKVKAAQLTPFQLYQQLQQQQQMQQRANGGDFATKSFQPRYQQQQLLGQVQRQQQSQQTRAGGLGGAQSQQQQNQILLNNNQQSRPTHQQQKFQSQPAAVAGGGANAAAAIIMTQQTHNQPQLTSPQSNGGFAHPNRVFTGSAAANYNPQGSSSKNRRLGRALGQGKSVGVGRVHQKSRGYIHNGGLYISQVGPNGAQGSGQQPSRPAQKQVTHQPSQSMGQTQPAWIRAGDLKAAESQLYDVRNNVDQTIQHPQSRGSLGGRPKRKSNLKNKAAL